MISKYSFKRVLQAYVNNKGLPFCGEQAAHVMSWVVQLRNLSKYGEEDPSAMIREWN